MIKTNVMFKIIICILAFCLMLFPVGKFVYAINPDDYITEDVDKNDSDEEKMNYTVVDITNYMKKYYGNVDDEIDESREVIDAWIKKLEDMGVDENTADTTGKIYNQLKDAVGKEKEEQSYENISEGNADGGSESTEEEENHPIYQQPKRENSEKADGLDEMMQEADNFINSGGTVQYQESALQEFSNNFYNIMLSVGVAIAVIVGGVLGIKYMASSVEGKASTKKTLVAYAVGCVIVFGGFGIWKIIVTILQGI